MALQSRFLARALFLVVLLTLRLGDVLGSTGNPKAISDLKDAIVKALGFQANGLKISDFDIRDALVGQSVAYEFDLEIDDRILPFKLLEDVNRWEYVDLPIFRTEEDPSGSLVKNLQKPNDRMSPVLAPFQLVGPMELWIQDAKDMRLSLPNDVDAGVLKKVVLADGAVVTVKGARSVSLRHPLDLPLPFPLNQNQSQSSFASGLLTIANRLRQTSRTQGSQPLSLRIVGPTSLASSPSSSSNSNKLKLKRLAPGLVELSSSPSRTNNVPTVDGEEGEPMTLLTPERFSTMWPLASINGSNPNLVGFEALLLSVLGERAREEGSFRLVKAEVSAQTFMKLGFGVEKALKEGGEEVKWEGVPEWRTRPESLKMRFELLAKVDGEKVVPERVVPLKPLEFEDTTADNVLTGNFTMSTAPVVHTPSDPFTL